MKTTEALTWNMLAEEYDKAHPAGTRPARTQPFDVIFDWAANQKNKFVVDPNEGTLHKIVEREKSIVPPHDVAGQKENR